MNSLLAKIWFPAAVITMAAASAVDFGADTVSPNEELIAWLAEAPEALTDTVKYPLNGYRRFWTRAEKEDMAKPDSAMLAKLSKSMKADDPSDTLPQISARDTIKIPDSLRLTDPFRYKYYVALVDSMTHVLVRDSLKAAGDSLDWRRIDSIYYADSAAVAKAKFLAWYNALSPSERKKYDYEQSLPIKRRIRDSLKTVQAKLKAEKDSIAENTQRILRTDYLPDSLHYKRIVAWTHDREFHRMETYTPDTSYNYYFQDLPFRRKDIGATWLGVDGSPVMYLNYFNRGSSDGVSFYEPFDSWTFSPSNLPSYNTKMPFTELCYWGTLLANRDKENDNIRLFSTQNISPELNIAMGYQRFGGGGMLINEETDNRTVFVGLNYLGRKYLGHAGFIHNSVKMKENGGIIDNMWIRDTTVEVREINVSLENAKSTTAKSTFFLDQQYKIPFYFLQDRMDKREEAQWEEHYRDSIKTIGETLDLEKLEDYLDAKWNQREIAREDSGEDLTSAYIGHSSEFSRYTRLYEDEMSKDAAKKYFRNVFYYNPAKSRDSMRVMKLDNRIFMRLQPWSSKSIISKIEGGIGDRFLSHYKFESSYLKPSGNVNWNSVYVYGGAEGQYKDLFHWDATADYVFMGDQLNDLNLGGNMNFTFRPFRRAHRSPVSLRLHAGTSLRTPDYYQQHFHGNHYKWDKDFSKISVTQIRGSVDIPRWRIRAEAAYALSANNIYYDSSSEIKQNPSPVSVLSGNLRKDFSLFGDFLHLDHKVLFQLSSNQEVIPLPLFSFNLRYYIQFPIEKDIMTMQIGANAFYNTPWYTPGWNPNIGAFFNQREEKYSNGPVIDAFVNVQWKRACIFIKYQNAADGVIGDRRDFFSAHHHISTINGTNGLKLGIYWPFSAGSHQNRKVEASSGGRSGAGAGSFMSGLRSGIRGGE